MFQQGQGILPVTVLSVGVTASQFASYNSSQNRSARSAVCITATVLVRRMALHQQHVAASPFGASRRFALSLNAMPPNQSGARSSKSQQPPKPGRGGSVGGRVEAGMQDPWEVPSSSRWKWPLGQVPPPPPPPPPPPTPEEQKDHRRSQ